MRAHIHEDDQTRRQKADNVPTLYQIQKDSIHVKIVVTVEEADDNQNPDQNQSSVQQKERRFVG